jgi:hypothetical protein
MTSEPSIVTKVDVTGLPVAPIAPYKLQFNMHAMHCNSRARQEEPRGTGRRVFAREMSVHRHGQRVSRNPDIVTSSPRSRQPTAGLRPHRALA